jgi:hypothetical protein
MAGEVRGKWIEYFNQNFRFSKWREMISPKAENFCLIKVRGASSCPWRVLRDIVLNLEP